MTKQPKPGRGSSYELYDRVSGTLIGMLGAQVSNIKQVINLAWLVAVIIESRSIALSQLANRLPSETECQVVLRQVLSAAGRPTTPQQRLSVIVDGTMVFGDRLPIVRLSLAHGQRAIPLAWAVVPGTGLVRVERLRAMWVQVAE
ncbi:MAG: hypothetical protein RMN52_11020, partial [Anaerolineae bacterium]|nr:hypothetical protein [Candidatus Roseilinea sp.]MDW8450524.1 hypothetical protein [Anaerolineae bacterium]